ncbi:DUF2970 domain-containing protein [Methylophilaceae bacterium]|jgi:hypothetical protein|nr:DUF2970 domain-containing protein [Methylophilaceae bacterium]|tara:strand:+ start:1446 stop:1637 length:192 start_codon:yes stop_codon:yes gene_type:complete
MKNILLIIKSVLAAFCGIQSNKKFNEDDDYIQKNGVSSYILIGFTLVFLLGLVLYFVVGFILS